MELEVVEKTKKGLTIKVIGEDHTFCNPIRKLLYEDDQVTAASCAIDHPLLDHPKIYVKAEKSPERALIAAAEKLADRCDEVQKKLLKALRK